MTYRQKILVEIENAIEDFRLADEDGDRDETASRARQIRQLAVQLDQSIPR